MYMNHGFNFNDGSRIEKEQEGGFAEERRKKLGLTVAVGCLESGSSQLVVGPVSVSDGSCSNPPMTRWSARLRRLRLLDDDDALRGTPPTLASVSTLVLLGRLDRQRRCPACLLVRSCSSCGSLISM